MNRSVTNAIRWIMDELVPAAIRDSRWFMWPFYCAAYRTLAPERYMHFKSRVWTMTDDEYGDFYRSLNSVSRNRLTDNNEACIDAILSAIRQSESVLDVGCGRGHVLRQMRSVNKTARLVGADLLDDLSVPDIEYVKAEAHALPFADGEFDVVCCTHVLEHVKHPEQLLSELLRVAKRCVLVVTPKQRPFYYTLDEHINFFFYREQLLRLAPHGTATVENLDGDWFMRVEK